LLSRFLRLAPKASDDGVRIVGVPAKKRCFAAKGVGLKAGVFSARGKLVLVHPAFGLAIADVVRFPLH
jgi:hypothetical protein